MSTQPFIVTKQHRRFIEFSDAVRRHRQESGGFLYTQASHHTPPPPELGLHLHRGASTRDLQGQRSGSQGTQVRRTDHHRRIRTTVTISLSCSSVCSDSRSNSVHTHSSPVEWVSVTSTAPSPRTNCSLFENPVVANTAGPSIRKTS